MHAKPLFLLALGTRLYVQAQVETVTLFDIAFPSDIRTNPNSIGFSILGVNSQGATTYIEDGVESLGVIADSTTTVFAPFPTPLHIDFTLVEDASHLVESVPPTLGEAGFAQTCTWDSDGQGACVAEFTFLGESAEILTTASGTKNAFTTLIVSVPTAITTISSPLPSSPSPSSSLLSSSPSLSSLRSSSSSSTTTATTTATTTTNYASSLRLRAGNQSIVAMVVITVLRVIVGVV